MDSQSVQQFIRENKNDFKYPLDEFSSLMNDITTAAKIISYDVNRAGLINLLGEAGTTNVQGEEVKKLDVYANDKMIEMLAAGGQCCVMASEENDDVIEVSNAGANYAVLFDPLDGSSNIDVNASIGTIFSIYRRMSNGESGNASDCLQQGAEQVAAGYVIYGSSTILVYTSGNGVNGFTLDSSIGEFCLSHPNIKTPANGKIYSMNEGNLSEFPEGVKQYVDYCKEHNTEEGRPYSARYIGSLVADFHRNLLKGGIFIYPPTAKAPKGKLRLLYEANPMAFIMEQAGGSASDGRNRILSIQPTELHQRTPLFIGSKNMVAKAEELFAMAEAAH